MFLLTSDKRGTMYTKTILMIITIILFGISNVYAARETIKTCYNNYIADGTNYFVFPKDGGKSYGIVVEILLSLTNSLNLELIVEEDKDWNKILKSFDSFFKGWDIAAQANKDAQEPKKPKSKKQDEDWKPRLNDVSEHCTLPEIEEFLKDDPELTNNERFELYYEEHQRVQKQKHDKKAKSLNQICKELNIKRNTE